MFSLKDNRMFSIKVKMIMKTQSKRLELLNKSLIKLKHKFSSLLYSTSMERMRKNNIITPIEVCLHLNKDGAIFLRSAEEIFMISASLFNLRIKLISTTSLDST
jgi:hypothetical protein